MIMMTCESVINEMDINNESRIISYLPYPHGFEQCLFSMSCMTGCRIGFYQGNPLKLVEDCALLKPTIFPSVPRLFNKIYGKIKDIFDSMTGCKSWLVKKAFSAKKLNFSADPRQA
jgi:long-chain acyl-CoA synthetase